MIWTRSAAVAQATALASLLLAAPAAANGQFPAADHLVVAPNDPSRILARTTFGLLTSSNAGTDWDWICENGVGYTNYEPAVELTFDGTAIAGFLNGLGVAHGDLCSWALAGDGLEGQFITDVTIARNSPSIAFAITAQGGTNISKLWRSSDDAQTWAQAGIDMPPNFLARTVDVAPTDLTRVYVSGSDSSTGVLLGRLARSNDGGESWERLDIPGAGVGSAPYIAAIHPTDPDIVYVRLDGAPGTLLITTNGGESFQPLFTTGGFLKAFALSPDGATVLAGGELDGIYSAPGGTADFVKISSVGARCLKWEAAGVYACADETTDGFTLGLSTDQGASFAPLLHLPCLRGPLACDGATTVGATCPAEWPALTTKIGAAGCSGAGGGGGDEPTTGTGGAGGQSEDVTATSSATASASTGAGGSVAGDDGCSCSVPGRERGPCPLSTRLLLASVFAAVAARIRSRRPRGD